MSIIESRTVITTESIPLYSKVRYLFLTSSDDRYDGATSLTGVVLDAEKTYQFQVNRYMYTWKVHLPVALPLPFCLTLNLLHVGC